MDDTAPGEEARPRGVLAEKLTWLMQHARPAGRGPLTTHQAAALVREVTGESIAHTTIWKIGQGLNTNPGVRIIEALARTFGVPVGYFFGELTDEEYGLIQEQVELLAMIRDAGIDSVQLRTILGAPPGVRQAIVDLIRQTAQAERSRAGEDE
jgi:transcriptional regulator with XRE-family HTH domain